jgi:hypothetical protein
MNEFSSEDINLPVWLLITLTEDENQQYSANGVYSDKLSERYEYQNRVANSRNLSIDHIVLLRNTTQLLGVARIKRIDSRIEKQEQLCCPICNTTKFYLRENKQPKYRGNRCGHEFDIPAIKTVAQEKFTAYFGDTFVPAVGAVSIQALRQACPKYNKQASILRLDFTKIEATLIRNAPDVAKLLTKKSHLLSAQADDFEQDNTSYSGYCPTDSDNREIVNRQIKARRGQPEFRKALRSRYGDRCMVTGCKLLKIVEAAHISPYRSPDDNHPENGLLLRADLHTLFDLNLMGIHPESLTIHFHPSAIVAGYDIFEGQKLKCSQLKPSQKALSKKWQYFQSKL